MSFQFIQLPPCPLVAFLNETDTSFEVSGFLYNDGITPVAPADIGDICFATLEPRTERAELISFTIDSVTEDGVATVTAVRGLSQKAPYGTGGASFGHQAGSNLVISNNPGLLNQFAVKGNDEVITGNWTFNNAPVALDAARATDTVLGNVKLSSNAGESLGVTTVTIANPAVISNVAHGLIEGDSVRFTTAGSLPSGLTTAGEYFVLGSGLTTDTFQLALSIGGTPIETTGAQSGVHTLIKTTPTALTQADFDTNVSDLSYEAAEDNKIITEQFLQKNGGPGDGSDDALDVGDGVTTTLETGRVYNYTTINVHANGTLKFSGNDWIILRATGNVTIDGTVEAKGIASERKGLVLFGQALQAGTPMPTLGLGGTNNNKGGDDGTTNPSTGQGGAGNTGAGNPGANGNGTTIGGGGGSGTSTEGLVAGSGTNAIGVNGGDGGASSGDNADGGSGGAGVDTGNGGNGGSGSSRSGGVGGAGGDSGQNDGNGGDGGSARYAGPGGNGYNNGGNGGAGNGFNMVGFGGPGGIGGIRGGNGGDGDTDGNPSKSGGNGGDGAGGATPLYLYVGGNFTFSGQINAFGGNGGDGGVGGGNGGDGGDGSDIMILHEGTATITGDFNNYGGAGGFGGTHPIVSGIDGADGLPGRDGSLIVAQPVSL